MTHQAMYAYIMNKHLQLFLKPHSRSHRPF